MVSRLAEPSPKGDGIPFVRRVTEPEEHLYCEIVGGAPEWRATHYNDAAKRTSLCEQEREENGEAILPLVCPECMGKLPERVKGYLAIWHYGQTRVEFLEITHFAWLQVKMRLADVGDYRGHRLSLKRQKGRKSRFEINVTCPSRDYKRVAEPPPELLDKALRKMMRL